MSRKQELKAQADELGISYSSKAAIAELEQAIADHGDGAGAAVSAAPARRVGRVSQLVRLRRKD